MIEIGKGRLWKPCQVKCSHILQWNKALRVFNVLQSAAGFIAIPLFGAIVSRSAGCGHRRGFESIQWMRGWKISGFIEVTLANYMGFRCSYFYLSIAIDELKMPVGSCWEAWVWISILAKETRDSFTTFYCRKVFDAVRIGVALSLVMCLHLSQ